MKSISEFKGYRTRVGRDAKNKCFVYLREADTLFIDEEIVRADSKEDMFGSPLLIAADLNHAISTQSSIYFKSSSMSEL